MLWEYLFLNHLLVLHKSSPQSFLSFFFFEAETIFFPDPTQVKLYFLIWDTVGSPEKCIFLQDCKEEYIVFV